MLAFAENSWYIPETMITHTEGAFLMNPFLKRLFALTLMFSALALFADSPKYIILFIGDGLSTPQRMIAEEFAVKTGHGQLTINHLPNHATTRTVSANSLVTDSAASGTAIACGEKTNNGRIGLGPEMEPLVSVAEIARDLGRKVGIVTTVTMNHATPASFYGHRANRSQAYELGLDMITSKFDFFAGGGVSKRNDKANKSYKGDIYQLAEEAGYTVIDGDQAKIRALTPGDGKKVMAFGAAEALPYAIDMPADDLTLADYTKKALEMLENPAGFFLMVEGGSIDWAGHANEAATNLREVLAFDRAVRVGIEFAKKHPDETLIVVTGDHETGGMSMGFAGTGYALYVERLANQKCSTGKFDEILTDKQIKASSFTFEDAKPLLAENFGFVFDDEKAPLFVGEKELADLKKAFEEGKLHDAVRRLVRAKTGAEPDVKKFKAALKKAQIKASSFTFEDAKPFLSESYGFVFDDEKSPLFVKEKELNELKKAFNEGKLPDAARRLISAKAGVGWTSGAHTGLPVLTTSTGKGAERFAGLLENTDISRKLKALLREK